MYDRASLLESLKGQTVVLPDLFNVFPGWPRLEPNLNYRKLAAVSDEKLDRYAAMCLLINRRIRFY
jgi:hypothetical protein